MAKITAEEKQRFKELDHKRCAYRLSPEEREEAAELLIKILEAMPKKPLKLSKEQKMLLRLAEANPDNTELLTDLFLSEV